MRTASIDAIGLTRRWPVYSGADPWIGSNEVLRLSDHKSPSVP